jgi:hypothetical protein
MPMGAGLDAILGMTWWASWDSVEFYAKHIPKKVKLTAKGNSFTLTGKSTRNAKGSLKYINDWMTDAGHEIEVISPEQAAEDIRELRELAKKARKLGHAEVALPYLFRLKMLEDDIPEGEKEPISSTQDGVSRRG